MEAKDVLVVGVWAFAIIWLVGMLVLEGDLFSPLLVFFAATAVSLGAVGLRTEKEVWQCGAEAARGPSGPSSPSLFRWRNQMRRGAPVQRRNLE